MSPSKVYETRTRVFTIHEAAFAADVTVKRANQAIDREKIRAKTIRRGRGPSTRGLGVPEVVYLRVSPVLAPDVRPKLYRTFRGKSLEAIPTEFRAGDVRLDLSAAIEAVAARLQEIAHIHQWVETHPDVRGGEPVFRGTRTPVYTIARKLELGSSPDEIEEDYPHLHEGDLPIALRYAELYPRRGRPRTDLGR